MAGTPNDRSALWFLLDAIARHDSGASMIVVDHDLDPIRRSPEFRAAWDAVPNLTVAAVFPGRAVAPPAPPRRPLPARNPPRAPTGIPRASGAAAAIPA